MTGAGGVGDVELFHENRGGVDGRGVAGEGEGGAGLEVVVVGEADDAEGLEDGIAENGGEDVGLLLAGADGEVGVGEDEKDHVVDGGGADGGTYRGWRCGEDFLRRWLLACARRRS